MIYHLCDTPHTAMSYEAILGFELRTYILLFAAGAYRERFQKLEGLIS